MSKVIQQGLKVLEVEAQAILALKERLGDSFEQVVKMITACDGKIVLTGMGKSGQIARKLASTFSSTGTPAVFLHPAESSHGDLGLVENNDVVIALSYGGESPEFAGILRFVSRKGIPLIAITGKPESSLAKAAQVTLNVHVSEEACPLGLAPTASSTATLAMGDAVAMAVMAEKGFSSEDFAEFHPGGSLGYRLLTRVRDVMHGGDALPTVTLDTPIRQVFSIMTHKDVRGAAGIVDEKGDLVGVITDGDIRRRLEKSNDPLTGLAKDLMTTNPRTIDANELAEKALFVMEQFQIQMVFVLDKESANPRKPVGILHIQDLLRAKVR
ncbi:KpsF/GutQ family sugar-phosphate isomerase [Bdellovibrio bacteriovorus]|uniref:Polysialic acid capsule expression protein n=1 Tax=Bdellovibrio bacteriovorus str. Tiberius TaxID=1069642 RepID=K7Z7Z2_BDEBC|nr:KpsF/GutQ family sugar-phosphate isomerase [Bdellovibrio bacteriovorus]AFY00474.1 polysialic acid capsule expression protein [Bdellovibrio bacteriovorus str. Tiberius]